MLELITDRDGFARDEGCTVDLLVRIAPPQPVSDDRPNLNLTLVLDRSGSMAGPKLELTRQAAGLAVRSLLDTDRFSVVMFDDRVDTLIPSAPLTDKRKALELIGRVDAGGSTALFGGWRTGGEQALLGLEPRRVNRVVLLTDGQANVGETNPDAICQAVHALAQKGVQTTTIGFGADYNETLLRSMASSGDGNHFFVERPEQLPTCFEVELGGLAATLGRRVRLAVEPVAPGVVVEPLGDMERHPEGGFKLADLVAGWPMQQVFRLTLPPQEEGAKAPVRVKLSWESVAENRDLEEVVPLVLPLMTKAERMALPIHPEVDQQVGLAMAARARLEAMDVLRQGDRAAATRILRTALSSFNLPPQQRAELEDLARTAERGDTSASLKKGAAQSLSYSRGSITLSQMGGMLKFFQHVGTTFPIHRSAFVTSLPSAGDRPWERVEGMLAGLLHGERSGRPSGRGEAAVLTAVTLDNIGPDTLLDPVMLAGCLFEPEALAERFLMAPVSEPGRGLRQLRSKFDASRSNSWFESASAGCGGLQRMPAFLLPHLAAPNPALWVDVLFGTALTHNDPAALSASLGMASVLWDLLAAPAPPAPEWYLRHFLESVAGLETGTHYVCRTGRHDGWSGTLSEFVRHAIELARAEKLSATQALESWGMGAYLLEVVPGILYLLERHGGSPAEALAACPPGGWMGACVGACLGALHGAQPEWKLEPDQDELLARTRKRFLP